MSEDESSEEEVSEVEDDDAEEEEELPTPTANSDSDTAAAVAKGVQPTDGEEGVVVGVSAGEADEKEGEPEEGDEEDSEVSIGSDSDEEVSTVLQSNTVLYRTEVDGESAPRSFMNFNT